MLRWGEARKCQHSALHPFHSKVWASRIISCAIPCSSAKDNVGHLVGFSFDSGRIIQPHPEFFTGLVSLR